jgi:hypothetical protein
VRRAYAEALDLSVEILVRRPKALEQTMYVGGFPVVPKCCVPLIFIAGFSETLEFGSVFIGGTMELAIREGDGPSQELTLATWLGTAVPLTSCCWSPLSAETTL